MTMISPGSMIAAIQHAVQEDVNQIDTEMDAIQNGNNNDLGFKFMYQEWMQKILLSNGVDEDENPEW